MSLDAVACVSLGCMLLLHNAPLHCDHTCFAFRRLKDMRLTKSHAFKSFCMLVRVARSAVLWLKRSVNAVLKL